MTKHRKMDTADLAGVVRISGELGVVPQTVRSWIATEESFPEAVYDNGSTKNPHYLYSLPEVVAWIGKKRETEEQARAAKAEAVRTARIERLRAQLAELEDGNERR